MPEPVGDPASSAYITLMCVYEFPEFRELPDTCQLYAS